MKCISKTHIGKVRKTNQDSMLVQPPLYVVADGMGGHKGGEVASGIAVSLISKILEGAKPNKELLAEGIMEINEMIYEKQLKVKELQGMGTTFTALWEDEDRVLIAQVGDSRAYLLRGGNFKQITQDHSVVAELIKQGAITEEMAKTHPYRNVITRALGTNPEVEVDLFEVEKHVGDQWVICSDGLTKYLCAAEMQLILQELPLETVAEEYLEYALSAGGGDNITFLLLEVEE